MTRLRRLNVGHGDTPVGMMLTTIAGLAALLSVTLGAAAPVSATSAPAAASWTQFRYDAAHTGSNPHESMVGPANVGDLRAQWYRGGPISVSSPIVAGGDSFVTTGPRHSCKALVATHIGTGKQAWKYPLKGSCSDPSFAKSTLYLAAGNPQKLLAVNAVSGRVHWSKSLGRAWVSIPTVVGNQVFVSTEGGSLIAFKSSKGSKMWSRMLGQPLASQTPAVSNGTVYVVSSTGSVFAVRSRDGHTLWTTQVAAGSDPSLHPSLAVADGLVIVATTGGSVTALRAAKGQTAWSATVGGTSPDIAVASHTVFVANIPTGPSGTAPSIEALDDSTGISKWALDWRQRASAPEVANGVVYVTSADQTFHALNAETGQEL
jgi:eukaryotic-like serine/threonine-protein kinase